MLAAPSVGMHLTVAGRTYPCRECGSTIHKGDTVLEVAQGSWNNCLQTVKICLHCGAKVTAEAVANARQARASVKRALAGVTAQAAVADEDDDDDKAHDPMPCSECGTPVPEGAPFYATPCGTFCVECMGAHMESCGVCAHEFEFM